MEEMTPIQMTPIQMRQIEVAQYETNIATYTNLLKTLPTEWPAHLLEYKGVTNKHDVIVNVESLEDVELLSDLWFADECYKAIRTETIEKRKAESILSTLIV